jgi:NADH:ubiquinone oxidoreductase subunit 6 (subunit J)
VLERLPMPSQFDRIIMLGGTLAVVLAAPVLIVLAALLIGDQISAPEFVFWLAAAVIVAGALGAVLLPNVVHAALSLVATLLGVAGIYLLLVSDFIALVQILVYGGGVVILLLFGLMLTNAQDDPIVTDGSQKPFAFIVGALIGGTFIAAILDAEFGASAATVVPFEDFGARLFRDFLVPVIVVAVLLDIALTGAFVNARRDEPEPEPEPAEDAAATSGGAS